jgi:hypothetical protein
MLASTMLMAITMFGRRVTMGFSFELALTHAREEVGRVRKARRVNR